MDLKKIFYVNASLTNFFKLRDGLDPLLRRLSPSTSSSVLGGGLGELWSPAAGGVAGGLGVEKGKSS